MTAGEWNLLECPRVLREKAKISKGKQQWRRTDILVTCISGGNAKSLSL